MAISMVLPGNSSENCIIPTLDQSSGSWVDCYLYKNKFNTNTDNAWSFSFCCWFWLGNRIKSCLPSSLQGPGSLVSRRLEAKGGNVEIPHAQAASSVASECLLDPISFLQRRAWSLQPTGYHLTAEPSLLP